MEGLLAQIESLKTGSVRHVIDGRASDFLSFRTAGSRALFQELSYCFLTANFNALRSMKIQEDVRDGFVTLPQESLAARLREHGHRFPEARAKYIVAARPHADTLRQELDSFPDDASAREWVIQTFRGIGYKEASHFLRNVGYQNLAIIDFHIVDLLVRYRLISRPKTLTKNKYLEIEKVLSEIASRAGLTLAELDLYLWYLETGKVLK